MPSLVTSADPVYAPCQGSLQGGVCGVAEATWCVAYGKWLCCDCARAAAVVVFDGLAGLRDQYLGYYNDGRHG